MAQVPVARQVLCVSEIDVEPLSRVIIFRSNHGTARIIDDVVPIQEAVDEVERYAGRIARHNPTFIAAQLFSLISVGGDNRILSCFVVPTIQVQVGERTPPHELR